jgi:serine/threonine protein kinase
MALLVGRSLNRYQINQLLGEGGMGAVYKGHDQTLQRDVAIKIMHPHYARQPQFQERFLQEARSAARLSHPSIVQVHDFGQADGHLYIVMEFIPGKNLQQALAGMRAAGAWIPLAEAVELVQQVSVALDYVHRRDVLHRDIKPANIMLKTEPGGALAYRPVLTDLGLAKLLDSGIITEDGTSMGTPAYMSPEQALGKSADPRSDVYSLGVLFYELSTGQLPFPIKNLAEAVRYHTRETPPAPRAVRSDLPLEIEAIILKALAKEPGDRFADAGSFGARLRQAAVVAATIAGPPPDATEVVTLVTQIQQKEAPALPQEFQPAAPVEPTPAVDRIAVVAPGQTAYSLPFKGKTVTIGRDADNDVVLTDPQASRRHARIDSDGRDYQVTDLNSRNGTYLGDVRLLPGLVETWSPATPLRIGDTWLRLERRRSQPAATIVLDDGTILEGNETQVSRSAGGITIYVPEPELHVLPGDSVTGLLIVLNQERLVDHFTAAIAGLPEEWVTLAPAKLRLLPGEQGQVRFTIRPPRSAASRAGRSPLQIRVSGQVAPDEYAEIGVFLTVAPFYNFEMQMRPQLQRRATVAVYKLRLANQGNADFSFTLEGQEREDACLFEFDPPQGVIAAGAEKIVPLTVRPRRRDRQPQTNNYVFTITARAREAPELFRAESGQWQQLPFRLDLALAPDGASGQTDGRFLVHLANQTEEDLDLLLKAAAHPGKLNAELLPVRLVVPAGERRPVSLQLRLREGAAATGEIFPFTVTAAVAEAPDLQQTVDGAWQSPAAPVVRQQPDRQAATSRPGCAFWLPWLLANSVGWFGGLIAAGIAGSIFGETLGLIVAVAVLGAALAFMQWLVLRRYVAQAGWWAIAGGIGLTVTVALLLLFGDAPATGLLLLLLAAVAAGVAQFNARPPAGRYLAWLIANVASWPLAALVSGGVGILVAMLAAAGADGASVEVTSLGEALAQGLGVLIGFALITLAVALPLLGPLAATVTGIALTWLLPAATAAAPAPDELPAAPESL